MVIHSVFVAATLVLGLVGVSPSPQTHPDQVGPKAAAVGATLAVTDSFAPAPRAKKHRPPAPARSAPPATRSTGEETDEDQPDPRRQAPPASSRRRPAASEDTEEESTGQDDEDEDKPRPKHKARKKVAEEDEEDEEDEDDAPMASLPVIVPRLILFEGGASAMGRRFQFNTALQKEATFPRVGVILALETYPMLRMASGWFKKFGIGFNLAMEFGAAALTNRTTGGTFSFPVTQRRWSLDVRYAIPVGEHVVIVPALGYANNTFDLKTLMPVAPSMCAGAVTPCIAGIQSSYFLADLHLRIAATPDLAISLAGGYFVGLGVGKGLGQIGSERTATGSGYHAEVGANLMLLDWLAFRAAIPFVHYDYAFSGGTLNPPPYSTASETYYGVTGGLVLFTR